MKKIFSAITCAVIMVCCTKDPSVHNTDSPQDIMVTYASNNMQVSAASFTANDWLSVDFTVAADSIGWWVSDTLTNPYDSVPYYPGSDTVVYNPGNDTTFNPGGPVQNPHDSFPQPPADTTQYPHDTIPYPPTDSNYYPPPYDSSAYPHDTTPPPPHDTIINPPQDSLIYHNSGAGYLIQVHGRNLIIQIKKRGNYLIQAKAYKRNINGSYSALQTGYIKLSAH